MPPAGYVAKTHRETPLACHCKMGRCYDCRLCPRRSCKINRCECPAGPTRLRVPKVRKLGEVLATAVPGHLAVAAVAAAPAIPEEDPFGYPGDEGYGYAPPQQQQQQPSTERVIPAALANQVLRYKPLEYPQDVVEALQLPKRTILSRFQRRRIAQDGGGIAAMQTPFEKASLKRTRQTFRDGIQKLAHVLLPEAPEYLLAATETSMSSETDCVLKEVWRQAPRNSVQARTAAAVLVASCANYKAVQDVLSKYQWKKAQEDYQLLLRGQLLVGRNEAATTTAPERKKRKTSSFLEATAPPPAALPEAAAKPRAASQTVTATPTSPPQPTLMDDTLRAMMATMTPATNRTPLNGTSSSSQSHQNNPRPPSMQEEAQRARMATM